MQFDINIRPIEQQDYAAWLPLWEGYNAFYGRAGETALAEEITRTTWARFFDRAEPVFAIVAEHEGQIVGVAHYLFHRSTTRIELTCYLQDLFTVSARPTHPTRDRQLSRDARPPAMRQQLLDPAGRLRRQPCQHVLEVCIRVMPVELGRLNQAHHRCGTLSRPQ